MPRACDRCTIYISFYASITVRNRLSPMLWKASCIEKFLYIRFIFKHYDALIFRCLFLVLSREKRHRAKSEAHWNMQLFSPHDSVRHDCSKSFWRSLNRHHTVGHRQVFPHRVPSVFRLLQSDVLDHLSSHQRRSCGRSRAPRGSQVNDDVAALQIRSEEKRGE